MLAATWDSFSDHNAAGLWRTMWRTMFIYIRAQTLGTFYFSITLLRRESQSYNFNFNFIFCGCERMKQCCSYSKTLNPPWHFDLVFAIGDRY